MTRRLFWVGVGVAVTVVVIRRGKRVVRTYAPAALTARAEQTAQDASRRAGAFIDTFRAEFVAARAEREAELTAALMADGQPDPEETRAARAARGRPAGRHTAASDEDELGYSFY